MRQDQRNRVRVGLRQGGRDVSSWDAAVVRRSDDRNPVEWDVLVAESVMFSFELDMETRAVRPMGVERIQATNRLRLESLRFIIASQEVTSMTFDGDGLSFTIDRPEVSLQGTETMKILEAALSDVVAIETLSDRQIAGLAGGFKDRDRVQLRWVRLLWEGSVVRTVGGTLPVAFEVGTPSTIEQKASSIHVGGAEIPVPPMVYFHPAPVGSSEEIDADGVRHLLVSPPTGERFLSWSPDHLDVEEGATPPAPTPWDLIGIDEASFPL